MLNSEVRIGNSRRNPRRLRALHIAVLVGVRHRGTVVHVPEQNFRVALAPPR